MHSEFRKARKPHVLKNNSREKAIIILGLREIQTTDILPPALNSYITCVIHKMFYNSTMQLYFKYIHRSKALTRLFGLNVQQLIKCIESMDIIYKYIILLI